MDGDIALGVKVFNRMERLGELLESVGGTPISTVYIADDGEKKPEKRAFYDGFSDESYELEFLDLEYDAGLGYGREEIVERFDEEFLLIVDSDHKLPRNVDVLRKQLRDRPELGGVAGLLREHDRIRGACHDIKADGPVLVRDVWTEKRVKCVADTPLVEFDFVPNAAMFRRTCLEDQSWDRNYVIGKEHLDFYVAHKKHTDWQFAVSPTVVFEHNPGGSSEFVSNRLSFDKHRKSKQYFLDKWEYDQIVYGRIWDQNWCDPRPCTLRKFLTSSFKRALLDAPAGVQARVMDFRDLVRQREGKPPM